jgi:hypothetical protein
MAKSMMMRGAGYVARMRQKKKKRTACRLLVGCPEGKRPLERPKHRWSDNIKLELGQMMVLHGLN